MLKLSYALVALEHTGTHSITWNEFLPFYIYYILIKRNIWRQNALFKDPRSHALSGLNLTIELLIMKRRSGTIYYNPVNKFTYSNEVKLFVTGLKYIEGHGPFDWLRCPCKKSL